MTDDITYTYRVDGCYMGHVTSYDEELGHGIVDCNEPRYQSARPFTLEFFVRDYVGRNKSGRYLRIYKDKELIATHYKSSGSDQIFRRMVFDEIMEDVPIKMVYYNEYTSKVICQRTALLSLNDTGIFPSETETELQGIIDQIETGKNELTSGLSGITEDISNLTSSISSSVTNKLNSLSSSFEDKFNLDDGTYGTYLNDIKHSVDNISFPDLSGLSDSVDDLKDSIANITFPDLSGLSNTLNNVKTTLENIDIPSLGQISHVIDMYAGSISNSITNVQAAITRERNNIFSHIDIVTSNLKNDILFQIRSVKIDISNLEFPDLSFITDGFNGIETIINNLDFPTLESIKTEFENAATNIADKILERILDEIERRYNK